MMNLEKLPDLIIEGVSGASGGTYDKVRIEGVGRVDGGITANVFKGNGQIRVKGDLAAGELECNGTMNVRGSLSIGSMKVDGILKIGEGLSGENCRLNGLLRIGGDCELENFEGEGGFVIDGLLSAGHLDFRLQGAGRAREIGVESIVIRQTAAGVWSKLWSRIFPKFKPELVAEVIEGDFIDLEYTKADIVRGNVVIIGRGCSIGLLEYRSERTVHPDAQIGKESKLGG